MTELNFETVFTHHTAKVNDVQLHYVIGGQGEPIVLLHGWPTTWYEWRRIMPKLSENYTVVVPDTRGLGDSSRPANGYDKKTLAQDIFSLVQKLNFEQVNLVGHDVGGQIAYAYANEYPEKVSHLAILEVALSGLAGWNKFDPWHFSFHTVRDLPEVLVAGKERIYLTHFYTNPQYVYNPASFSQTEIDEYVRTYSAPDAMRAGFEYYRAFNEDAQQNQKYAQVRLKMPVMAVGGANSLGDFLYQQLQEVAENVQGELIDNCGHWPSIERPNELTELLLDFIQKD